jgi:hypothetical protein
MAGAAAPGLEQLDTQLQGIAFPIDLRPIGIDRQVQNAAQLNAINNIASLQLATFNSGNPVKKTLIGEYNIVHNINPLLPTTITVNGQTYNIEARIGNPSAYGIVHRIRQGGTTYCIKFQRVAPADIDPDRRVTNYIKEASLQHILYEKTKYNNHYDCPYVPRVIRVFYFQDTVGGENNYWIGYIQELYGNVRTLSDLITDNVNYNGTRELILVARKLQNLWIMNQFNHGDLHGGNILCIRNGGGYSVRLIDFGKSITNLFTVGTHVTRSAQGRDLTTLFAYIRGCFPGTIISNNQIIRDAYTNVYEGGYLLSTVLQGLAGPGNPQHWGAYQYYNIHPRNNNAANPATVIQTYYARLPVPALIGDIQATCAVRVADPADAAAAANAAERNRTTVRGQFNTLYGQYVQLNTEIIRLFNQRRDLQINLLGNAPREQEDDTIEAMNTYWNGANGRAVQAALDAIGARTNTAAQMRAAVPFVNELIRLATIARDALTRRIAELQGQIAARDAAQAQRNAARNATKDQVDALVAEYKRIKPELNNLRGQIVALSNQLGVAVVYGPEYDAGVAHSTANGPAIAAAYSAAAAAAAAVPRTNTQAQWSAILPQIQELVRLTTNARDAMARRVAAAQAAVAAAAQAQRNAEAAAAAAARAAIEQRSSARLRVEEAFARLQAVQEEYRRLETQNTELYRRLHGSASNPPEFRNIQRYRESFDAHINQRLTQLRAERDRGAARTNTAQNWLDLLTNIQELVRMAEARREAARTSIAALTHELAERGIEDDVTQVNEMSREINAIIDEIEAMRLEMVGLTDDLEHPQGDNPVINIEPIIDTFTSRLRNVRAARNNDRGRRNTRQNWQQTGTLMRAALTNLRALRGSIRERIDNLQQQTQLRAAIVMDEVNTLLQQINTRRDDNSRLLANPGIQINAGIQVPEAISQAAESQYQRFGRLLEQARAGGVELDLWNTAKQAGREASEAQRVKHEAIRAIIRAHVLEASRGEVRAAIQQFENQMRDIELLRATAKRKEIEVARFASQIATNLRPDFELTPSFPAAVAITPLWDQLYDYENRALAFVRRTNNAAGLNANRARGARDAWREALVRLPPLLEAQRVRDQAADRILATRGDFQQAIQDRSQIFTADDERQKAEYERILEERGLINDAELGVNAAKAEYERLLLVAFRSNRLEDLRQAYDSLLKLTIRERGYKSKILKYLPELLQIGPQLPIASAPAPAAAVPNAAVAAEAPAPAPEAAVAEAPEAAAAEAPEAAAAEAPAPDIMGRVWAGLRYVGGVVGLAGGKRRVYKTRKMRVKRGGRTAVATRSRQPNMTTSTFINRNTKVLAKKLNSVRPRQNVLAIQNANSQPNRMEPINLDILKFSGEYILDYMRFVVFPTLDAETMGAILYNMSTMPLRNENVANDLAKVMTTRSLDMLNEFIKKYTVPDIDKQLDAQNWPKNYKNMKTCFELYMSESDPSTAFCVLRHYIYREFNSQEAHDAYVEQVKSMNSTIRKVALGGYHFNAIDI